ncbi:MAG TPA: EAL domain-containing protein, partial [Burkholderiales bacterium]|nr:EAL domain-containing protein [Burkholderiales bacterium]
MNTAREILILNFLVEDKSPGAVPLEQFLCRALRALRTQLGLEAAFITRYDLTGNAVLEFADSTDGALLPGFRDTYAWQDEAPAPEPREDATLNSTHHWMSASPGRETRLSVSVDVGEGDRYGALVCVGAAPRAAFNERDITVLRVFAEMASEHLEAAMNAESRSTEIGAAIKNVISGEGLSCLYQPIVDVARGKVVAFEALARFSTVPARTPDAWFADAARVGLDLELGRQVIAQALRSFPVLPEAVSVAFNVSSNILLNGRLDRAFGNVPLDRVVIEINEHMSIRQYDEIAHVLAPLRERGLRIAVDDDGRGLDGFRHILNLKPNIIKLHRTLVHGIDSDPARRAHASALVQFGKSQGCELIAEGVESAAELSALKAL